MSGRSILAGVAGVALVWLTPAAHAASDGGKEFLNHAIQGDIAEIQLGKLAQTNASDSGVKDFGKTLVDDHTAAQQKAESVAQAKGITPPTEPPKDAQKEYDNLSKVSGRQFDKEFVDYMVKDHKKDIKAFQTEAKRNRDGEVAQLAQNDLPDLQKHLSMAESLQKGTGQTANVSSER